MAEDLSPGQLDPQLPPAHQAGGDCCAAGHFYQATLASAELIELLRNHGYDVETLGPSMLRARLAIHRALTSAKSLPMCHTVPISVLNPDPA